VTAWPTFPGQRPLTEGQTVHPLWAMKVCRRLAEKQQLKYPPAEPNKR
jgi:hypothetical protein